MPPAGTGQALGDDGVRCIQLASTDPAFNLAAEEWLLKQTRTDIFMLWRNARAVIVGRNQNTRAQIDEAYVRAHDIAVVRRLTGGGAVFHDLGNVNFTFIALRSGGRAIDFRPFTSRMVEALAAMGVRCSFAGRNDLEIDGKKISGNAQLVAADRVLHHGTLLFAADMADISGALRVDPNKYRDRAVHSVARRVTNIAAHLPAPMAVTTFMERLVAHVSHGTAPGDRTLSLDEAAAVEALAERKYRTWQWNYGVSPRYGFVRTSRTPGGVVEIHLDVAEGLIRDARIFGEFFGCRDIAGLESLLPGCRHDRESLAGRLTDVPLAEYMRDVDLPTFLDCLF